MSVRIIIGDTREQMKLLPSNSVHCVVTSPPYWGLRDYGVAGQIGLEESFEEWLAVMVDLFDDVRRVLRDDGVAWVNLGDCYANDGKWGGATGGKHTKYLHGGETRVGREKRRTGLKSKDLVGMPWRFAFAARGAGWYLRRDIIWSKPNAMPESVFDRPATAHEYIFQITKTDRYFYDDEAIKEPVTGNAHARGIGVNAKVREAANLDAFAPRARQNASFSGAVNGLVETRNKRSVWEIPSAAYAGAHFATFPPDLIEPCIMAGTSERGCCPQCGTGWQRVTAKVETGKTQKMPDGMATYAGGHSAIHKDGRERGAADNPVMTSVTIGWYPGCRCASQPRLPACPEKPSRAAMNDEATYKVAASEWRKTCAIVDEQRKLICESVASLPTIPAVVLDPFGGAGTTGLVADRLQRNAILIELNPEYAAMARRRIDGDSPLFARAAE